MFLPHQRQILIHTRCLIVIDRGGPIAQAAEVGEGKIGRAVGDRQLRRAGDSQLRRNIRGVGEVGRVVSAAPAEIPGEITVEARREAVAVTQRTVQAAPIRAIPEAE